MHAGRLHSLRGAARFTLALRKRPSKLRKARVS